MNPHINYWLRPVLLTLLFAGVGGCAQSGKTDNAASAQTASGSGDGTVTTRNGTPTPIILHHSVKLQKILSAKDPQPLVDDQWIITDDHLEPNPPAAYTIHFRVLRIKAGTIYNVTGQFVITGDGDHPRGQQFSVTVAAVAGPNHPKAGIYLLEGTYRREDDSAPKRGAGAYLFEITE